jgi:hypothetical protein
MEDLNQDHITYKLPHQHLLEAQIPSILIRELAEFVVLLVMS